MSDARLLSNFLNRLTAAASFEDAAETLLAAMFESIEGAFAPDAPVPGMPGGKRARVLRGVIHLRPGGTYQRIFGIEHATGGRVEGLGYLTSGNVWSWIEERLCSVSIDLARGSQTSWLAEGPIIRRGATEGEQEGFPGDATRQRMLGRDATHVHVVPMRAGSAGLMGMVTLEVRWQETLDPPWEECHEDLEVLADVACAFIATRQLAAANADVISDDPFLPVIGEKTAHLVNVLSAFANRTDTIMISGPTGAGKSRLGRWCHEHSPRKGGPFEVLDLIGIPEDLQMAELFGWKRGAFTGAVRDNPGAISRAEKGTLFLDEIDKLSLRAQAGLLRFIEERLYRTLGDDTSATRRADVRLLVGTNADLKVEVAAGRFREDLYYRINVLPVRLPPLAERADELPRWAVYMLERCHRESGAEGSIRIDAAATAKLRTMPWPGNLRQLDNIIRRAHALLGRVPGAGEEVVLGLSHVERAFTFDHDGKDVGRSEVVDRLMQAAHALVREASKRVDGAAPLSLDVTDAFRGLVLAAAVQQLASREGAFQLFGQAQLVRSRNHHRALRRELVRVREFFRTLGVPLDPELEALLRGLEERDSQ